MDRPCTLTRWRVDPAKQSAFLETVSRLEAVLLRLPRPPGGLTLLQSVDDPKVFHSIGWFPDQADLEAMREHAEVRPLLEELVRLSSEFQPSAHTVVNVHPNHDDLRTNRP